MIRVEAEVKATAWEDIDQYTDRLRVPGGWIVRSSTEGHYGTALHQIFVADPAHEWTLEAPKPRRSEPLGWTDLRTGEQGTFDPRVAREEKR